MSTQGTARTTDQGVLMSLQIQEVWQTRISLAAAQDSGNAPASSAAADIGKLTSNVPYSGRKPAVTGRSHCTPAMDPAPLSR